MSQDKSIVQQKCESCHPGMPVLSEEEIQVLMGQLDDGWILNISGHLYRKYIFSDFVSAMDHAHKVGIIAEKEGHHPYISITWGMCSVELWTHEIGGLSRNDFILASKIDVI